MRFSGMLVMIELFVVPWICHLFQQAYQELIQSEGMIEHLVRGLKETDHELQKHCASAIFKVYSYICMYVCIQSLEINSGNYSGFPLFWPPLGTRTGGLIGEVATFTMHTKAVLGGVLVASVSEVPD